MPDSLNKHFLLRKLHALSGVVPVGVFLMFHLWENSMARKGAEYFNVEVVEHIGKLLNYKELVELTLAGAILFHAFYGIVIWWQGSTNVGRYAYGANFRYVLQRITSITTFAFIIWHVWHTRIAVLRGIAPETELFEYMKELYQNPVVVVLYVIGLTGATFHLANGLWLAGITWGITTHPRSQRISLLACGALFLVTTALGYHAIWGFIHPVVEAGG